MGIEEYLELCKRDPPAYATAAERMLAGIGEPELVDTRNDPRLSRIFANKVIKRYPAFREFYGMEDAIEQVVVVLPPRGAGPGREEADPLPARPGRRRQVVDRRAAEAADGAACRSTRIKGSPVNESPLGLFDAGRGRRRCWRRSTASRAATCTGIMSPVGGQAPARNSAATSASSASSSAIPSVLQADRRSPRPSRATRTTRTSPRWSARSTSASSRPMRRTTRTPTATPAACAWPTRACSNSSRCSRRRSRCCTRC